MRIEDKILQKYFDQVSRVGEVVFPSSPPTFGTEVAPPYKAVLDQSGVSIWYDDNLHVYFILLESGVRVPMTSITTLIHAYSSPFDVEMMSYRCALKDNYEAECLDKTGWAGLPVDIRKERIKKAWSENSKNSTDYGTYVHAVMEAITLFPNEPLSSHIAEQSMRYDQFHCAVEMFSDIYQRDYVRKMLKEGWTLIAEPLIYDLDSLIAGQSDVVAIHHERRLVCILDFKTNKRRPDQDKAYNNMLGGLQHLKDFAYSHYCLQLCIYQRLVLLNYPGYRAVTNVILWLDREEENIEPLKIRPDDWKKEVDYLFEEQRKLKKKIYEIYKLDQYKSTAYA